MKRGKKEWPRHAEKRPPGNVRRRVRRGPRRVHCDGARRDPRARPQGPACARASDDVLLDGLRDGRRHGARPTARVAVVRRAQLGPAPAGARDAGALRGLPLRAGVAEQAAVSVARSVWRPARHDDARAARADRSRRARGRRVAEPRRELRGARGQRARCARPARAPRVVLRARRLRVRRRPRRRRDVRRVRRRGPRCARGIVGARDGHARVWADGRAGVQDAAAQDAARVDAAGARGGRDRARDARAGDAEDADAHRAALASVPSRRAVHDAPNLLVRFRAVEEPGDAGRRAGGGEEERRVGRA